MLYHQDANFFYRADTGELIMKIHMNVPDYDIEAAQKAREYFVDYMETECQNPEMLPVEFE